MDLRRAVLAIAVLSLGCGPTDSAPADGGRDAPEVDGGDPHMGFRLPPCEDTDPAPATPLPHVASTLVSTLVARTSRLASAGPENPITEDGEAMYRMLDYHLVDVGPANPHLRREELGATTTATTGRRSLAWFSHLSDFQLVDDESPVRLGRFDSVATSSAVRAHEASITHAVSATNRTITRIEAPDRPIDFGIVTGDCADSAQRNELRWVIEVMNGADAIEVDSGDDDDPVPGPDNDPKDPFDATAFPAPWLYVPGNHDVEIVGVTAPTDALRMAAVGDRAASGTRDYRAWYAPITRANAQVPADPEREILDRDDIVAMLREAGATGPEGPAGLGYPATGPVDTSLGASYAFDAIPGLLRILVLDTNDRTGGSSGMVVQATIDGWLVPELDRAVTDGVLVMLASHHATTSIDTTEAQLGGEVPEALTGDEIEDLVTGRPEVIAWIVGHSHQNRVRAVPGPDAAHPGYWEIMTSAIADFPGQTRMIELVDNGDDTLSIYATSIDFDTDSCLERRYRALLTMEWVSGWSDDASLAPSDQNVELVRAIPTSAAAAVAAATGHDRIESLTTLTEE